MKPERTIGEGEELSKPPKSRRARRQKRYELQEQIGAGGMGVVYRAIDRELNRVVAVKVLRPEYASSLSGLLRLKRELALASRVSDRHIVRVHDFGEVDGRALIAMDWVDGESLASLIGRVHSLPPAQVYDFATQICRALQAIHGANIVHRDLKPGNLLINRDGDLLVADFGLARADLPEDRSMDNYDACGTPRYMAPEQLAGLPANERSDLYSFGMILLEMLTGTTALEALDPLRQQWLSAHTERHIRSQELCKLAMLDAVIRRCLRLDRSERYPSADAILADLARGDFEVVAPHPDSGPRFGWRTSALVAIAGVVLVLLLVQISSRHVRPTHPQFSELPDQLYARAISSLTPTSGEPELRAADQDLIETLAQRPNYLPAAQALVEVRIKLYEAAADPKWLSAAQKALRSPAASSLPEPQRLLLQARIDLDANQFSRLVSELQDSRALLAASADANRLLGRGLDGLGRLAAALPFYRRAVHMDPDSWICHNDLGSAFLRLNLPAEARGEFVRVTQLQPASPVGFSNLGLASLYAGDRREARENFERALERQALPSVYFNLGLTTYLSHQYASALPYFESSLRMRPNSDLYQAGLAAALWHLGRKDAARDAYSRALAMLDDLERNQPLTTEQFCRRAIDYARVGDTAMATMTLDAVRCSQPKDQNVLYTAAVLALMNGRKEAAKHFVTDALRMGYPSEVAKADPDLERLF